MTFGGRGRRRSILIAPIALLVLLLLLSADAQAVGPTIYTDKPDYAPGETVTIFGYGFRPDRKVQINVTRPDGVIDSWSTRSDASGAFTTTYQLDGIIGTYLVTAKEGKNVATTTFTDAPPKGDLDQCENGGVFAGNPAEDPCVWVNGNLNEQNSHFVEGQSVPYRLKLSNLPTSTTITVTVGFDIRDGGKNALDYLTSFQRISETVDPCDGVSGCGPSFDEEPIDTPNSIAAGGQGPGLPPVSQPDTSFLALPASERNMRLYNGDITDVAYVSQGSLTGAHSETQVKVTFTVTSSTAVLAWGGHIASMLDWGLDNSASGLSGSPYHMRFIELCAPTCSGGNQDRSLKTTAVKAAPTITTHVHNATHADKTESSVPLGAFVHDNATLTGATSTAGGTVTYRLFGAPGCTGTFTTQTVPVTNGVVPESTPVALAAGSYSYNASYSGDDNNLAAFSICENFVVLKRTPTITTQVHNGTHVDKTGATVPLGTTVHDNATVSSLIAAFPIQPTATVTFRFWTGFNCVGTPADSATVSLSATNQAEALFKTLAAGTYSYNATFSGDANYTAAFSVCENFEVVKRPTTIATAVHLSGALPHTVVAEGGTVVLGTVVHDNSTVSGLVVGFPFAGSVTYNFFSGSGCAGTPTSAFGPFAVGVESTSVGPLAAGLYSFNATFSGDDNYEFSASACENFEVLGGPTRTQGFWATHLDYTESKFGLLSVDDRTICGQTVDTIEELMGAFWSNVAQKTDGTKRSPLDHAKMILIQQYFAAVLNRAAFGTNDGGLIQDAQDACDSNLGSAILDAAEALAGFNEGGDGLPLPPGEDPGPADPQEAQAIADKEFWDEFE